MPEKVRNRTTLHGEHLGKRVFPCKKENVETDGFQKRSQKDKKELGRAT